MQEMEAIGDPPGSVNKTMLFDVSAWMGLFLTVSTRIRWYGVTKNWKFHVNNDEDPGLVLSSETEV